MIEKLTKLVVPEPNKKDKDVRCQRSQCRTTHKRQDC